MQKRLIVLQNGLRDFRGHYFETAVSIAEAAREFDLKPILAAHVDCPPSIIPDWLECFPVCRVDHWGATSTASTPKEAPTSTSKEHPCDEPSPSTEPESQARPGLREVGKALLKSAVPSTLRRFVARGAMRLWPRDEVFDIPASEEVAVATFAADLEQLLELTHAGPHDHVFLPTAHGRDLIAVAQVLEARGASESPTFHLEYRHALDIHDRVDLRSLTPYAKLHHRYFRDYCRKGGSERILLYCDTDELAREYSFLGKLPFGTLPIPFNTEFGVRRDGLAKGPACLTFLGEARDEKGFHWLRPLVESLRSETEQGAVRFVFQASVVNGDWTARTREVIDWFKAEQIRGVELVGHDRPLTRTEYYELLGESDIILCPYDGHAYRQRSSGVLTEAIAMGIPTVVPSRSWLQSQQPAGTGTSFRDCRSFVSGTRQLLRHLPKYRRRAESFRLKWLARHSPQNLVRQLLQSTQDEVERRRSA